MGDKLYKIWTNSSKKAILASSLQELKKKGSEKLLITEDDISAFLQDGTELDDEEVFQALNGGTVIYLLSSKDKV